MSPRRARRMAAVAAGALLTVPFTLGAARAPASVPADLCVPLITACPAPSPTPTPSVPGAGTPGVGLPADPAPVPTLPGSLLPGLGATPSVPALPGDPSTAIPSPSATPDPTSSTPVPAPRDSGTTYYTKTPASMGSKALSFTGLVTITVVTLPTVDGSGIRVLKMTADSVTVTGFSLTVRQPNGPGLVTSADTMTLRGHVNVYVGSITATTIGGQSLSIGTDTPPPLDTVAPGLANVTMGLVGSTADSITYVNTNQRMVQP
ncbi:hypothetical protein GCM10012320_13550 [Sinomonas cellulolyticus]|uniref:Uncharacterized protein n=1 Tax=Sinomonas cellulolyticus TaxID=2801916 RepID=A0ABS1JZF0_9MICC|nr:MULTISPECIES: hypothetical protein [Sinomonas]MBL0704790.1 hypothetical protein [Sinomonas cellulolyticus]GHG47075.1 hypothetical protein GCM10012320_13550 [Sinomonas sp. KCTC 49339]